MKKYALFTCSVVLIVLTNCSNKQEEKVSDISSEVEITELSANIGSALIDAYIDLKDALIESDAEEARLRADELRVVLKANEAELKELSTIVDQLAESEDIEQQRQYFSLISENLYQLIKAQDNNSITLYKQFCPMVFKNEGAFWLSKEDAILNPYFGDKMLKCGKVLETIVASN